jgi:hypothetical protein
VELSLFELMKHRPQSSALNHCAVMWFTLKNESECNLASTQEIDHCGVPRCVRLALAFLVAVNVTAAGLVVDLIDEAGRPQRFHGVHQMDET